MVRYSQKLSRLSTIRNGQYFAPVYDEGDLSPLYLYQRLNLSRGYITCWEQGTGSIIKVSPEVLVRRVVEAE